MLRRLAKLCRQARLFTSEQRVAIGEEQFGIAFDQGGFLNDGVAQEAESLLDFLRGQHGIAAPGGKAGISASLRKAGIGTGIVRLHPTKQAVGAGIDIRDVMEIP